MNYFNSQLEALVRIGVPGRNDRAARLAARAEMERLRTASVLRIGITLLAVFCIVVMTLQGV
jgi:hypothetical protein